MHNTLAVEVCHPAHDAHRPSQTLRERWLPQRKNIPQRAAVKKLGHDAGHRLLDDSEELKHVWMAETDQRLGLFDQSSERLCIRRPELVCGFERGSVCWTLRLRHAVAPEPGEGVLHSPRGLFRGFWSRQSLARQAEDLDGDRGGAAEGAAKDRAKAARAEVRVDSELFA
eukprot:Amastigsp_a388_12.p3 type:complete len:170 gc:universal Amastigsp_a388_12:2296-1787(-)